MQVSDLVPGSEYRFEHERLGSVRATFLDWETDGEIALLRVSIYTGDGTERPDLARANVIIDGEPRRPDWTDRQFRTELLTEIYSEEDSE